MKDLRVNSFTPVESSAQSCCYAFYKDVNRIETAEKLSPLTVRQKKGTPPPQGGKDSRKNLVEKVPSI